MRRRSPRLVGLRGRIGRRGRMSRIVDENARKRLWRLEGESLMSREHPCRHPAAPGSPGKENRIRQSHPYGCNLQTDPAANLSRLTPGALKTVSSRAPWDDRRSARLFRAPGWPAAADSSGMRARTRIPRKIPPAEPMRGPRAAGGKRHRPPPGTIELATATAE